MAAVAVQMKTPLHSYSRRHPILVPSFITEIQPLASAGSGMTRSKFCPCSERPAWSMIFTKVSMEYPAGGVAGDGSSPYSDSSLQQRG